MDDTVATAGALPHDLMHLGGNVIRLFNREPPAHFYVHSGVYRVGRDVLCPQVVHAAYSGN